MEKITAIVPVFNAEKYLRKCVDSIVAQDYSNIEIILVDDGSNDSSPLICDELAQKYVPYIKVIHKQNGGLSSARNCGIENATGDYLCFIDSDDWIESNMFSELHRLAKKTSSDIVCGAFDYVIQNGEGNYRFDPYFLPTDFSEVTVEKEVYLKDFERYALLFLIISCNKIYKREIFANVRFAFGKRCEDELAFHEIIGAANRISVLNKVLYHYYMSEGSITRSEDSWKNIVFQIEAYRLRREYFLKTAYHNSLEQCEANYVVSLMKYWHKVIEINCLIAKKECKYLRRNYFRILKNSKLSKKTKLLICGFCFSPNVINMVFFKRKEIKASERTYG